MKIADGVDDNWSFLAEELPDGVEALDFFHASEHLHAAVAAAYGDGTTKTRHRYEELREILRDEPGGVGRVIRALDHLRRQHPRAAHIRRCAAYFRKHRHRMDYAGLKAAGLPIGSGLVEAACKTLVAQRPKLSGMRWGLGAQAILTHAAGTRATGSMRHEPCSPPTTTPRSTCSRGSSRSRRQSRCAARAGQDTNYTLISE